MCFSAPASLIAGGTLSYIGKKTIQKTKDKSEYAFAGIPLIFGIQQIIEGLVWIFVGWPTLNTIMSFAFLIFAYVVWPTYVPVAVFLMEKNITRRKILKVTLASGIITSLILLYSMIIGPVYGQVVNFSIVYSTANTFSPFIIAFYLAATCLSCLVSSHRMVSFFGIIMVLSSFFSYQCYSYAFVSVWCFFAAILSVIIYLHFDPQPIEDLKSRLRIA